MKKGILFLCSIVLMSVSYPVFAQERISPNRNLIHSEGIAEVKGQNDSARIFIGVRTAGQELEGTASENATRTRAVIAAVRGLDIKGMKVRTTNYRVTPQTDYKSKTSEIKGYEVYNEVEITMENFHANELAMHVSKIFKNALDRGANNIRNVNFYIQDTQPLENQGLRQATRVAMENARVLAEAAGVKLKRIATISMQPISVPIRAQMFRSAEAKTMAGFTGPPIEAGESTIQIHVSMAYEIE